MKKLLLSISVVVLFASYSLFQRKTVDGAGSMATPSNNILGTRTTLPISNVTYKDGVYTGSVADAFYGNIQVQANIQNGKLANVTFLQYPNDRERSIAINSQAMPYLKQEAIAAQSANVDIVSGATASSQAFVTSLTSALSQAI